MKNNVWIGCRTYGSKYLSQCRNRLFPCCSPSSAPCGEDDCLWIPQEADHLADETRDPWRSDWVGAGKRGDWLMNTPLLISRGRDSAMVVLFYHLVPPAKRFGGGTNTSKKRYQTCSRICVLDIYPSTTVQQKINVKKQSLYESAVLLRRAVVRQITMSNLAWE